MDVALFTLGCGAAIGLAVYAGGRLADWWDGRAEARRRAALHTPTRYERSV